MTYRIMTVILLVACVLVNCQAKNISCKVIGIKDGDTIVVLDGRKQITVRLEGVDCPELKQAYGRRARQFTSSKVYEKVVELQVTGKDRYGRTLAKVYFGKGTNLERELLAAGMAWHYKKYSSDQALAHLETKARKHKIGLWAENKPIPPWVYRRK